MATITEPGAPGPEPLRAKEIKNRSCILKPTARGEAQGQDGAPWYFAECDVWVLDRHGVERHESGVRISWKRVLPQLEGKFGQYILCKPKELDNGGVVLEGLTAEAREVAERVVDELTHPNGQHELPTDG